MPTAGKKQIKQVQKSSDSAQIVGVFFSNNIQLTVNKFDADDDHCNQQESIVEQEETQINKQKEETNLAISKNQVILQTG